MLDTELEVIAHLDDFEELQCEHPLHDADDSHAGPASLWMHSPCGHSDGFRCATWRAHIEATARVTRCPLCGILHAPWSLTFTPIS